VLNTKCNIIYTNTPQFCSCATSLLLGTEIQRSANDVLDVTIYAVISSRWKS